MASFEKARAVGMLREIRRDRPQLITGVAVTRKDVRRMQIALHPDRVLRARGRVDHRDLELSQMVNVLYSTWASMELGDAALSLEDRPARVRNRAAKAKAKPAPKKCTVHEAICRDMPVSCLAPDSRPTAAHLAEATKRWNHDMCEFIVSSGVDPARALEQMCVHDSHTYMHAF